MAENIYDLDYVELEKIIKTWGYPSYRTKQIWQGLYQQLYTRPEAFTNLPHLLLDRLSEQFCEPGSEEIFSFSKLNPGSVQLSSDRETQKTLFAMKDGRLIEAVLMRYDKRQTLCISSQAGCAMGCVFCATGQMGFFRHLSSGEIVEQVIFYARLLATEGKPVTNVVVMGMGEPFHNYEATIAAIDRLNHQDGMKLGARRFTISTVGLTPVIRRFASEKRQINLAVSLHAAENELRQSMLPINKKYPLEDLMAACKEYIEQTHRRITFEWALIEDVNDTPEEAQKLGKLLNTLKTKEGALLVHVNAIPLNPTRKFHGKATTHERAAIFQLELEKLGIPCTIRIRRGIDIQAGCGQLAGRSS